MSKKKKEAKVLKVINNKFYIDNKEVDPAEYYATLFASPKEAADRLTKRKTGKNVVTGK